MAAKYLLTTLGCKVNQYESQQIRETLNGLGWRPARLHEAADLVIVNTCAVTAGALRKSRQAVRRGSRQGQTPVIVVGCGAAAQAKRFSELGGVAATLAHDVDPPVALRQVINELFPPEAPLGLPGDLRIPIVSRSLPVVKTGDQLDGRIEGFAGHQRAFLKIQDGCDAHCTYCIIPRLRPALRSKPVEIVVQEARGLVAAGHREIILTGIFLGAYGRETAIRRHADAKDASLAMLVGQLAAVDGLARLRLSSLEPGDLDDRLIEVLATREVCVPHLHLPLQSGSAEVLRRMNRQYTRDEFLKMIDRVRAALYRPSITTDIIVGFPGETNADFEATLQVARLSGFSKIHAFPFSPRESTAAARWTHQFVQPSIVKERMQRLVELEVETSLAYRRSAIGKIERVLVEAEQKSQRSDDNQGRLTDDDLATASRRNGSSSIARGGAGNRPVSNLKSGDGACTIRHGRTDRYFEVHFDAPPDVRDGQLVRVRIDRVTPSRTLGTLEV